MERVNEIECIDEVIKQLKILKSDIQKKDKLSQKALQCEGTINQRQKFSVNLNWQCMHLDKQRKSTWKSILKAEFLNVDIEETEYNPSGFHTYRG
ncbi:hypothetical protein KRE49_11700 [Elizabethkingia meningoseptica]|uniref:hypothetical protein n=1 Tax=Elizabethkingia meningoseptica TaxID=238 RepID=UPI0023B073AD|nr:hypothetical protein [Elizabethkingia meningoseptica]MDE5516403.1 hypothetical protein [Elizabethkingia meningoseptica]MDE5526648.1 hypothetical protein [Elizabethkingia meningoseptica]MDN4033739.1 hypothetical protein [Elizabethkingia meningoseptica]